MFVWQIKTDSDSLVETINLNIISEGMTMFCLNETEKIIDILI